MLARGPCCGSLELRRALASPKAMTRIVGTGQDGNVIALGPAHS